MNRSASDTQSMVNTCPFELEPASIRVLIEITRRCNQRCVHCFVYEDSGAESMELPLDIARIAANRVSSDPSVNSVWISGGEPLLHTDVVRIAALFHDAGKVVSISTNGLLLTRDMASELRAAGIAYFHLSLDGACADTHDAIRGRSGSFQKVCQAAEILKGVSIKFGLSCVLCKANHYEAQEMASLGMTLGAENMSFYPPSHAGRAVQNARLFLNEDELTCLGLKLERIQSEFRERLRIDLPRLGVGVGRASLGPCHGERFLTITADGNLGPCPWFVNSYKQSARLSIVTSNWETAKASVRSSFVAMKAARQERMVQCESCECHNGCGKGCPAQGMADPACWLHNAPGTLPEARTDAELR